MGNESKRKHFQDHHFIDGRSVPCSLCKKSKVGDFKTPYIFIRHVTKQHRKDEVKYVCNWPMCEMKRAMRDRRDVLKHIAIIHGKSTIECTQCSTEVNVPRFASHTCNKTVPKSDEIISSDDDDDFIEPMPRSRPKAKSETPGCVKKPRLSEQFETVAGLEATVSKSEDGLVEGREATEAMEDNDVRWSGKAKPSKLQFPAVRLSDPQDALQNVPEGSMPAGKLSAPEESKKKWAEKSLEKSTRKTTEEILPETSAEACEKTAPETSADATAEKSAETAPDTEPETAPETMPETSSGKSTETATRKSQPLQSSTEQNRGETPSVTLEQPGATSPVTVSSVDEYSPPNKSKTLAVYVCKVCGTRSGKLRAHHEHESACHGNARTAGPSANLPTNLNEKMKEERIRLHLLEELVDGLAAESGADANSELLEELERKEEEVRTLKEHIRRLNKGPEVEESLKRKLRTQECTIKYLRDSVQSLKRQLAMANEMMGRNLNEGQE